MKLEIRAMIKVISTKMSIEEISTFLGISCTKFYRMGEPRSGSSVKFEANVWMYNSPEPSDAWPDVHLDSLSRQLKPYVHKFKELGPDAFIECALVIECDQEPPLNFTPEGVQFLAEIGAGLDIDQYIEFNPDEEDEDED